MSELNSEADPQCPKDILDNLINSNNCIDLTGDEQPTGSKLFEPLFSKPDLDRKKKRKLEDFLKEFHTSSEKECIEIVSSEDEEEEEEEDPIMSRDPEVIKALCELDFPLDKLFKKVLKTHQIEGLDFMWDRVYKKKQGCLLAHSMGLGKTIQIISLLTTMYQELKRNPETKFPTGNRVLILAPLVTLTNWEYEFRKWAVEDAGTYLGEVFNITKCNNGFERKKYIKYWFNNGGVMLINYDRFRSMLNTPNANDKEEYFQYLLNPGADIVILDEAHRIKNSTSSLSAHVNRIRTRSRICMTGYPLQNHLTEYYYMINFIAPGLFGDRDEFKAAFGLYIEKCYADSSKTIKEQAAFKLYVLQLVTSHVSHRRDDLVLKKDLTPKTEFLIQFKLTKAQHKGYVSLLHNMDGQSPLAALTILRSICNHPKIFHSFLVKRQQMKRNEELNKLQAEMEDEDFIVDDEEEEVEGYKVIRETVDSDTVEDDEESVFDKWAEQHFSWTKEYFENADIESWKCSGKMSFVMDLANECKLAGEKLVIVSHSLACLDYIQHLLPVFGIKYCRLDGSILGKERQSIIDKFNEEEDIGIMLLSAKAAAIGINVTAANRIVLIDQDWNPLYDEQSIGRVYRYGQSKPVFVYRLVTTSTIEERIYKQSVHKKSISRRVIDNKPAAVISREELTNYFQRPSVDLGCIDVETDLPQSLDWISKSAVAQNSDHITACQFLEEKIDKKSVFQLVPSNLKDKAKLEARTLLSKWKRVNRL